MADRNVDIGFLEEGNEKLLHPKFFPSKVGGKPCWLDLINLPKDLTCKKCNDPLVFLCQVYAPYEELEYCFHRTIFIFVCKNGSCCSLNNSENFLVLRCQLPRENEFYSFEPCDENTEEEFSMEKWSKLCEVCGARAPSHCSKCKKSFYCGRKHQILDWQKRHKEACPNLQTTDTYKPSNFVVTQAAKSVLFKQWELIVDEEDKEDPKHVDEYQEMNKYRKLMQEKKAGTLDDVDESELEQYTKNMPEDKVFDKFSKRVARHPDQVLRYDRAGNPLWITGQTGNSLIDVPKCPYCNGERQFEFQVMPQLLNFIEVGIELNSIDWGVLVVYTCKASCNQGPAYKEEYLIKQDLSN